MSAPWKVWSTHLRVPFRMISAASCYGRMQDRAPFLAWGSTISFGTIPAKEQGSSAVEARRANSVIDASRHDGGSKSLAQFQFQQQAIYLSFRMIGAASFAV